MQRNAETRAREGEFGQSGLTRGPGNQKVRSRPARDPTQRHSASAHVAEVDFVNNPLTPSATSSRRSAVP